jgi:hypothetical protein
MTAHAGDRPSEEGTLTEFEQRVALALASARGADRVYAERFAPRVAAAIEAAIRKTDSFCPWWATHGGLTPELSAKYRAAVEADALAALAGERPGA